MATPIFVVDAFTDTAFAGNPAGVCLLDRAADESWMAKVGREMNHAETAFLVPIEPNNFGLRWFTPTVEVDLCGHATLASAHILWQTGSVKAGEAIRFQTKSGELIARQDGGQITLNFPVEKADAVEAPPTLRLAVNKPVIWVGQNRMDMLVQLEDASSVRSLGPSISAIALLGKRGVIVTAESDQDGADYVYRSLPLRPASPRTTPRVPPSALSLPSGQRGYGREG